jgi:KipI family sensor histidine kinase inhibitor
MPVPAHDSLHLAPLGDTAVVLRPAHSLPDDEVLNRIRSLADSITGAGLPAVIDVVPSPDRVTVIYDPLQITDINELLSSLTQVAQQAASLQLAPRCHEVPVCYGGDEGPDLEAVCCQHDIDRNQLIEAHTAPDYVVTAIGFVPGFPYLAGLPECLATPRLATPRTAVPAGSVGIGGGQTGIYPFATPGGWHLLGRTSLLLFDPTADQPNRFAVGDRVRFYPSQEPFAEPAARGASAPPSQPTFTLLEPGLMTSVQDLGRPGQRAAGVPSGGAADSFSARLANLLVGNPAGAALLEFSLVGPTLRFETDAVIALTGGTAPGLPALRPFCMQAGETLSIGPLTAGCRGYLAIAGGIDLPPVFKSRATYLPAALGGLDGRTLTHGDSLAVGPPSVTTAKGNWQLDPRLQSLPNPSTTCTLRYIPAAEIDIPGEQHKNFEQATFGVTSRSDRMGLRLSGRLSPPASNGVSHAVMPGTIQLPPDGHPILLLADAQTIGGYPVLGQVIAADLPLAGQLRSGHSIRFEPTTRETAHQLLRKQSDTLMTVQRGLASCLETKQRHTP